MKLISIVFGLFFIFQNTYCPAQTNKPTAQNAVPNSPKIPVAQTEVYNIVNSITVWEPQIAFNTTPNLSLTDQEAEVRSYGRTTEEVRKSTQYLDGLGRPMQKVGWQQSGNKKDLVNPVYYDEFGKVQYNYLPFESSEANGSLKLNAYSQQQSFCATLYPGETFFYGHTVYEASPLNRVLKTYSPGNVWAGTEGINGYNTGQSISYFTNKLSTDQVRVWNITNDAFTFSATDDGKNIPTTSIGYSNGKLIKVQTTDENGHSVVEYKDFEGKVILKKVQVENSTNDPYSDWLNTYYVYDELGLLRFVIPPKAVSNMSNANSWILSQAMVNELCFRYEYDNKQRMIAKKVPGSAWVYMVYDKRDRLVYTQDGLMRSKTPMQWMVSFYDILNRPVMSGIMTKSISYSALNDLLNSLDYASTTIYEDISINTNPLPGFSNGGEGFVALSKTDYDDYTDANNVAFAETYSNFFNNLLLPINQNALGIELNPSAPSSLTLGQVTRTRVRVLSDLNNLANNVWLPTHNFYNDKGRLIQKISKNYANQTVDSYNAGNDIITILYDFSGKILSSYDANRFKPVSETAKEKGIATDFEYNHMGKPIKIRKRIFNALANTTPSQSVTIVRNSFDALGQLLTKNLGQKRDETGVYTITPIETLDYEYNIRGWLKSINKNYAKASSTADNRWFGMILSYEWGFEKNQYNGNISGITWRSNGDDEKRSFGYGYDNANRLLYADFKQLTNGTWNNDATIDFTVLMGDGINYYSAYDPNGNILEMKQKGIYLNTTGITNSYIDELSYAYFDNSNKLKSVDDTQVDRKLGDFVNGNIGDDYGYDLNGNMLSDKNKRLDGLTGIDKTTGAIEYNYLNLPSKLNIATDDNSNGNFVKGVVTYIYDAAGNKLAKKVIENPKLYNSQTTRTVITNYSGFSVFEKVDILQGANQTNGETKLQFLNFEEGRIREGAINSENVLQHNFDYFIKDHLGNIRMVLTDEQKSTLYHAGMEDANRTFEVSLFGDKINSTYSGKPSGFDADVNNLNVSKVNGTLAENRVGPGIILKVMTGDKFTANTQAWYLPTGMDNTVDNTLQNIAINIANQLSSNVSALGKGTIASNVNSNIVQPGVQDLLNTQIPQSGSPKAYLNWVLLDEKTFKAVASGFRSVPQIVGATQKQLLQLNNGNDIEITKNGYLYVYVSNESKGNVYFDDINIQYNAGPLLEETHYYPFGLTMSGITSSSLNFGNASNKKLYNGKEFQNKEFTDNGGLELYDFGKRMQDPQLGRWCVLDPKADLLEISSPYVYCYNNPITYTDPDGELAIFINGRASGGTNPINYEQSLSHPYWSQAILDAVSHSGIPYGSNQMFVDGDRYYYEAGPYSKTYGASEDVIHYGSWITGHSASSRNQAGYIIGKQDFQYILSRLHRDPETNKIIEKIEIYTHSRGAAFGAGYVDALLEMIKQNADQFADADNEIDLVYNAAPNEAGRDGTKEPLGVGLAVSHHHSGDKFSDTDQQGTNANMSSDETAGGPVGRHLIDSFVKDITAFSQAFASSINKKDTKKILTNFINTMQQQYGITVTVEQ
ncbi:DUF6443 domain-containing protein [Limnovirga soli]|uniref:DUF6443 domain-containing protein n=1 Tax=Limnovirga soli TaxID=2656915 RepID=A0A8J8F9Y3_9BACT|nr:DUF6443 domain-containing protein [Limnovirga soli]NNV53860.1 hypothetical protein [Limnovirga soli]